jgi:hypothetical protein
MTPSSALAQKGILGENLWAPVGTGRGGDGDRREGKEVHLLCTFATGQKQKTKRRHRKGK